MKKVSQSTRSTELASRSLGSKFSLRSEVDFEHLEQNFLGLILDEKGPKFDALIIDEAQDLILIGSKRLCFVSQIRVMEKSLSLATIIKIFTVLPPRFLKSLAPSPSLFQKMFDNTEPIFEFSQSYYSGVTNKGSQVKGPNVRFIEADANLEKLILRDVNKLINHEGVPRENIAVLTLANIENSLVRGLVEKFPRSDDDKANSSVIFDSALEV